MLTLRNIDCRAYLPDRQKQFLSTNNICTDYIDDNEADYTSIHDHGTALISSLHNKLIGIASYFILPSHPHNDNNGNNNNADDAPAPEIFLRIEPYIEWIHMIMTNN